MPLKLLIEAMVSDALLKEGVMDDETTQITRMVFFELNKRYQLNSKSHGSGTNKSSNWTIEYLLRRTNQVLYVVTRVVPGTELSVNGGRYRAFKTPSGEFRDEIILDLELPKQKSFNLTPNISSFYSELRSVIRHELEHAQQQVRGGYTAFGVSQDDWASQTPSVSIVDYLLSPDEVESYVMQFYRTAKSQKTTIEKEMNSFLKKNVLSLLSQHKVPINQQKVILLKLKKAWMDYARKRLPGIAAK
jgi:hypothetical protein